MNQILSIKLNSKSKKYKNFFILQLWISVIIILIILCFYFYNQYKIYKKEQISKTLINSYELSKLYSGYSSSISEKSSDSIIGIINIPKINIYYPIFSNLKNELLEISPCRFSGDYPGSYGNLCIARS